MFGGLLLTAVSVIVLTVFFIVMLSSHLGICILIMMVIAFGIVVRRWRAHG